MKSKFTHIVAAAALAVAVPAAASAAGLSARVMQALDRVSDPRLSPDGRNLIYDVRKVDSVDQGKTHHELWLAETNNKTAPRRLTVENLAPSAARWSTDGRTIFFLADKGGVTQLFRTGIDGEGVTQVTSLPLDVQAYRISTDGKAAVVGVSVFADCPTLECTVERLKTDAAAKGAKTGQTFNRVFVRHWDTWVDGRQNHLFALTLGPEGAAIGKPIALMTGFDGDTPTKPFGDDADFAISPNGRTAIFSAKVAGKDEPWTTNYDLWSVALDGSARPTNLTEANKAWDAAGAFSPDGKLYAYRAMKRPGFEADRYGVMIRDLATGQTRELAPAWDRSADSLAWAKDGKSLYVVAGDLGQTRLFSLDLKTATPTALTGPGHLAAFDVGRSGLAYAQDSISSPAQIFLADLKGGKARAVTANNKPVLANTQMGDAEQFSFPGWNGETVYGYVVKPVGYDPAKRYPVAFLIHGGPQSSMANGWSYRWNPQIYAAAGYAAVMIDFHGSTGYGQGFTDAISRHWGDRPLEDLQKGWAYAAQKYPFLDTNRACALGASYGGYMINWIAGTWNTPWKCLVSHDGVFDTRAMGSATEELWFTEWENGGRVGAPNTTYEIFNPVNHVEQWKVPMLVVEGGRDFRVPFDQAMSSFNTLQRRGIDSRFLYFPDESHWVLKPQNSVQWHDEVLGWLGKYTK